jgi:hypothetical protein
MARILARVALEALLDEAHPPHASQLSQLVQGMVRGPEERAGACSTSTATTRVRVHAVLLLLAAVAERGFAAVVALSDGVQWVRRLLSPRQPQPQR